MNRRYSHHSSHRYPDDPEEYWVRTRQPLTCLAFLTPLLIAYEAGVFWVGGTDPEAVRNGADFWMRGWLDGLGLQQALLLPALVGGALFVWHLLGRYPWPVFYSMNLYLLLFQWVRAT